MRTLLTRGHKLGKFDFIYASGLYDYLAHNVAVKLTKTFLPMLKPNGTFLFRIIRRATLTPATG